MLPDRVSNPGPLTYESVVLPIALRGPAPGRPTVWIIVGQGPTALAVGAVGGCLDIFSLVYHFCFLTPSLWETARYRLKYCLKGPLSPKQPTNQPTQINYEEISHRRLYDVIFTSRAHWAQISLSQY